MQIHNSNLNYNKMKVDEMGMVMLMLMVMEMQRLMMGDDALASNDPCSSEDDALLQVPPPDPFRR